MTPQIVRETRYFPLPKRCWTMFSRAWPANAAIFEIVKKALYPGSLRHRSRLQRFEQVGQQSAPVDPSLCDIISPSRCGKNPCPW